MAKIVFDESKITIGDLEDFEDAIGIPLTEALATTKVRDEDGNLVRHNCADTDHADEPCRENGRPEEEMNLTAKTMKGLVWIVSRQSDPDFTLEDARAVRVTELEIVDPESSDPTNGVG